MPKSRISQFVEQRLRLNARAARWMDSSAFTIVGLENCTPSQEQVRARRLHLDAHVRPSPDFVGLRAAIIARQSIGDPPPKAANDNAPAKRGPRVRKSSGKYVRGAMAETLPAVLAYRNTPDHIPEPVTSGWSVDPSAVIPEPHYDDNADRENVEPTTEDRLLVIKPSIAAIMRQVNDGQIVRGDARPVRKDRRQPSFGPIVRIGSLRFSDGTQRQMVTRMTERGVETKVEVAPVGAMLGTIEGNAGRHGGDGSSIAALSNRRTTELFFGKNEETKRPHNWRPFIPRNPALMPKKEDRKNLNVSQSRALIAEAIANTPVMPPVTQCPPGVATGTARFSDQFVGLVSGSTGKGGAPNWVDHYTAIRDRKQHLAAMSSVSPETRRVLDAAMHARNFAEVGQAIGQGNEYARRQGGRRALIAANDNYAAELSKSAA